MQKIIAFFMLAAFFYGLDTDNLLKYYYKKISIAGPGRRLFFYKEMKEEQCSGKTVSLLALENRKIIKQKKYFPEENLSHVVVFKNNEELPVKIIEKGYQNRVITLSYNEEKQPLYYRFDHCENPGRLCFSYYRGRVNFTVFKNKADRVKWAANYYYKSNEIKIISFYPGGRLKQLEIYKKTLSGRLFYKKRVFRQANADFISDQTAKQPNAFKYNDRWQDLQKLDYASFPDWHVKKIYKNKIAAPEYKVIVDRKNRLPEERYYRHGILQTRVKLQTRCNGCPFLQPDYKIYDDGFNKWIDYTVTCYDLFNPQLQTVQVVSNGLLIVKYLRCRDREYKKEKFFYYKDRSLMQRKVYLDNHFYKSYLEADLSGEKEIENAAPAFDEI
ncbi:MAG TPA: hypothetical protein VKS21_10765 [Spirochaetota bacterium]|nr:hypothetical protein [Spirochaetota bacterium]